jgi:hypothetical protein
MLKNHLATIVVMVKHGEHKLDELFEIISMFCIGEALFFAPAAMLDVLEAIEGLPATVKTLGYSYVKICVRKRLTADEERASWHLIGKRWRSSLLRPLNLPRCMRRRVFWGVKRKGPEALEDNRRVDVVLRAAY